jgi:leucyl/phenylalanyl-tRNA---protein transferase
MPVFRLSEALLFPPPELAREDGLLAVGGDLSVPRLLLAYRHGIFPWYGPEEPILWWAPDPRLVLFPADFHCSRSLARLLRRNVYRISMDRAFAQVVEHCARLRLESGEGTWLSAEMQEAYCRLHALGHAHSVECWQGERLVGGLYGVALGAVFFGESMFSLAPNSSKAALVVLVRRLQEWGFDLIDCQVASSHLQSLGACAISGAEFSARLALSVRKPVRWQGEESEK